jgi:hypothetical protein
LDITSGQGGDIAGGQGSAGNSGNVAHVTIDSSAADTNSNRIHSGQGGSPRSGVHGNGGNSGNVSGITITDTVGATNPFEIYAGVPVDLFAGGGKVGPYLGMQGIGAGAKAGSIGTINGVTLDAPGSKVIIGKSDAAGSSLDSPESVAGNGGAISNVSGKVGTLDILAPSGGDAGTAGKGGSGGSISKIDITAVTQFVHLVAAGDGGDGKIAGAGGSVSGVTVAGDIGDFTTTFGLSGAGSGMGGLVSGIRGTGDGSAVNGSIATVSATRIATILAGRPSANAVGYGNAVTTLSGIAATVIGADVANDGFTYTEGGSDSEYQPDSAKHPTEGDTAVDGFVLVKKNGGGASLPVSPLKLIEV